MLTRTKYATLAAFVAALLTVPVLASDPPGPSIGDGTDVVETPKRPDLGDTNYERPEMKEKSKPSDRVRQRKFRGGDPDLGDGSVKPDLGRGREAPADPDLDVGRIPTAAAPSDFVDCNGNGRADSREISVDLSLDFNGNGRLDSCEGLGDFDHDGQIGVSDLVEMILHWGGCIDFCQADLNMDGSVDVIDLIYLLQHWG